jgi:hypothetical protein
VVAEQQLDLLTFKHLEVKDSQVFLDLLQLLAVDSEAAALAALVRLVVPADRVAVVAVAVLHQPPQEARDNNPANLDFQMGSDLTVVITAKALHILVQAVVALAELAQTVAAAE